MNRKKKWKRKAAGDYSVAGEEIMIVETEKMTNINLGFCNIQ